MPNRPNDKRISMSQKTYAYVIASYGPTCIVREEAGLLLERT